MSQNERLDKFSPSGKALNTWNSTDIRPYKGGIPSGGPRRQFFSARTSSWGASSTEGSKKA